MKFIYSLFFSLFIFSEVTAQDNFPKIESPDFAGIKINRTESYDGNSLWGYIDGGADLYLEFGFSKLTAQEIEYESNKYRIDIYRMKDAEAAFGIFSVSRFKCGSISLAKYSCVTEYQSQAVKGSYYVSVVNEKGTPAEQSFTQSLAEKILSRINDTDFELPKVFATEPFVGGVKSVNGILGVQNSNPDWENMFAGINNFKLLFSSTDENDKFVYISIIKFTSSDDLKLFEENLSKRNAGLSKDIFTFSKKINDAGLIYGETNKEDKLLFKILE